MYICWLSFFFFKQKTAYEMRISDWSSDVCSSDLRQRIYGHRLNAAALRSIVEDVVAGRYSDVHLAAFLTATAALPFDEDEAYSLTKAMVDAGDRLRWPSEIVVDKHSVGGLPGNRTTPIIVAIRSDGPTYELQSLMRISYA